MTWATSVPILVFVSSYRPLGSLLRPVYATDRQTDVRQTDGRQTDVRRAASLNASALWGSLCKEIVIHINVDRYRVQYFNVMLFFTSDIKIKLTVRPMTDAFLYRL